MLTRIKQFRFDWKLTLLVLLFLPVTLRLGFWQLDREQEKLEMLAVYDSRQQSPAVNLATLATNKDLQYTQVEFTGDADNQRIFLLDNRVYRGQAGYEVIQLITTTDKQYVLLNRGWIPQGQYRDQLPEIAHLPDQQTYKSSVYVPMGDPVVLDDKLMTQGWPKVIQVADVNEMGKVLGINARLFPYITRINEGVQGTLVRYWPVVNLSPEKHLGYAVQWFAMSFTLVLIYLYYSTRGLAVNPEDTSRTQ